MAASKTDDAGKSAKPKSSSLVPFLMTVTSSFTLVLIAMMFVTGAAQRSALPRLRELKQRVPLLSRTVEPPAIAAGDSAVSAADRSWSVAADSLANLEERLSLALREIDAARAAREAAQTSGVSAQPASAAPVDSAALYDLSRFVKVLEGMKPPEAARILNAVDESLAIEAMRKLKDRQAGKILAQMDPARAVTVGEVLGRGARRTP